MVGGGGACSRKLKKLLSQTLCASFSWQATAAESDPSLCNTATATTTSTNGHQISPADIDAALHVVNICAICLDPLNCSSGNSKPYPAIFTAQCSHSFHFTCISSNVSHGSITCPICRAHWTQLPRHLDSHYCSLQSNFHSHDPILQILDDSIASFRVHRRSFLLSAHYDDDDPVEPPDHVSDLHHRLHISLLPFHLAADHRDDIHSCIHDKFGVHSCAISSCRHHLNSTVSPSLVPAEHPATPGHYPFVSCTCRKAYDLRLRLEHQPATDLVLIACPNGPHLRLMKQAMALVILSLRTVDRLAIVTHSSTAAARMLPLKRMTSYGKRIALQVIDRLFHTEGPANTIVGLKKGVKILDDRVHRNPECCILHISDGPTRSPYHSFRAEEVAVRMYGFQVGFGFSSTRNGVVMHEFEEFLARILGGAIKEIQLKVKENGGGGGLVIKVGELRGGEERRIAVRVLHGKCSGHTVCVEYSYVDGGIDHQEEYCRKRSGEIVIGVPAVVVPAGDQSEIQSNDDDGSESCVVASGSGRTSCSAESWEYYHDHHHVNSLMMARRRRWAKHLRGNRAPVLCQQPANIIHSSQLQT